MKAYDIQVLRGTSLIVRKSHKSDFFPEELWVQLTCFYNLIPVGYLKFLMVFSSTSTKTLVYLRVLMM